MSTTGRAVASAVLGIGAVVTGLLLVVVGSDATGARIGLVTVGLLAAAVLAWAAVRGGRWLRLGWYAVALGAALQTLALLGAISGWPAPLVWGTLRPLALTAFAVGLIASPGVWRDLREWALLMLDGWLVAASTLAITWCALALTAEPAGTHVRDHAPLVLVPLEVVAASVCAGLTLRTAAGYRLPAALLLVGSLCAVSADATWAATGDAAVPATLWLGVVVLFAFSSLFGRLDVFVTTARPAVGPPRVARASQVVLLPGLLACVVTPQPDTVTLTVALSLLVGLAAQMTLSVRRYGRLWTALQDQADRLDALVSESADAILQVDEQGRVEFANAAAAEVFGRAPHELTGRQAVDLIHPGDRGGAVRALIGLQRTGGDTVRVAARVRWADGWRHLEATVSRRRSGAGYTLSTRDVSERVRLEEELRRQATTDALTGLLSRGAFLDAVEGRLRQGRTAVLFLDLDGFKSVNDTEGHAAGDQLLVRSARAVESVLGPRDVAARLGGDEFAVLAASDEQRDAEALAARLVRALAAGPSSPLGARVGASVGVALAAGRASEGAAALVRDADLAMYEAKKRGGRTWAVFEPWMRERVLQRTRLHAALGRAIEEGHLRLEVQPIVALPQGERVGFEALVRWEDAGRLRGAGDFVPLAEETGLVVPLGTWVLRQALAWLASWPDPAVGIAVNVAGRQVAEPGFGDLVRGELAASGVEPGRLTLEITERTAVDDLARAGAVLQPLRALGVHVALDDFGTGFSSLGYLAGLPVDELKIDRRFVDGLGVRSEDEALVRAVLALAADLGLRVVAEGVETPEQARALVGLGCGMAQGLLYGSAVPIERLGPSGPDLRDTPWPGTPEQRAPSVATDRIGA